MPSWIQIEVKDSSDDDRSTRSRSQEETSSGGNGLLLGIFVGLIAVVVLGGAGFLFRDRLFGNGDVVAVVNGDELTRQQLVAERQLYIAMSGLTQGQQPVQTPSDFEILNQMIADRLKVQEAQQAGISASPAEAEAQISALESQAGFTQAQLDSALAQAGIDRSVLQEWLGRQLVIGQYVNQVLLPNAPDGSRDAVVRNWSNNLQARADVEIRLSSGGTARAAKVGEPAPDFALPTPDGEMIRLSDLRGQPVLVNFWATWCPPCKIEMPDIEALYQKYKDDGLEVIAVDQQESPAEVQAFFDEMNLSFQPVIDSTGEIFNIYRVVALPMSYFIDADGIVRFQHRGMMTGEQMEDYASQLMSN